MAERRLDRATSQDAGAVVASPIATRRSRPADVLLWNGTLDQSKERGDRLLDRQVHVELEGLAARGYRASLARVDATHSNIAAHWAGEEPWPDAQQLAGLRAADVLHEESLEEIAGDGAVFDIRLPMPGIARLRLRPA